MNITSFLFLPPLVTSSKDYIMVRTHRYNNDLLWQLSSRATHEMATGLTFKSISMKGCMFMSLPPKCTSMISRAAWLSLFSLLIFNRDMRSSGKKTIGNKSTFFKRVVRMVRVKCSIASNSHVISPGSKTQQFSHFVVVCLRVCEKKSCCHHSSGFLHHQDTDLYTPMPNMGSAEQLRRPSILQL